MNEKIREFEKQCWNHQANCLDAEKFAELIVQECIDNVKIWEKDSRNHISYLLKNHYGVGK